MHGIPFQQSIEQSPLQFYSIFDPPEFIVSIARFIFSNPCYAPYGCSTSQEVAGSIPYIVLAQFRLELTKLSCLCLVNPLTNAHLPVPVPPGPRLFQRQGVWLRFSD
jgi:hypothetical protein